MSQLGAKFAVWDLWWRCRAHSTCPRRTGGWRLGVAALPGCRKGGKSLTQRRGVQSSTHATSPSCHRSSLLLQTSIVYTNTWPWTCCQLTKQNIKPTFRTTQVSTRTFAASHCCLSFFFQTRLQSDVLCEVRNNRTSLFLATTTPVNTMVYFSTNNMHEKKPPLEKKKHCIVGFVLCKTCL